MASQYPIQIKQTPKFTSIKDWTHSDAYHNSFLIPQDPVLNAALKNSAENGLPEIAVSTAQGKFLHLHAQLIQAKRILEVGRLAGEYSTIWLGHALPGDGELITLEINNKHAKVTEENLSNAGLSSKCKVIVGPGHDSMVSLPSDKKFDLIFINANKPSNLKYFTEAKRLVRKGGIIIVDNIVCFGCVTDPQESDHNIEGVRLLLSGLKGELDWFCLTLAKRASAELLSL
ncbi:S-adenosyl-L-methionine-dependent methyltransferase [Gymnopus androsaceus JB14]|uniref:S-adenosyl-L-methionine-dependent methyltransferase n=1 Tax=Gymnopus androsaceus JB14 TaxID=1447944 RepID=A0A6A4GNL9_9AGAR|nr:S-adenosyl-L-methionine-dependent methyltransferase [Gymnopus androsaceus JB14]